MTDTIWTCPRCGAGLTHAPAAGASCWRCGQPEPEPAPDHPIYGLVVRVGDTKRQIHCPICGHEHFSIKETMIADKWLTIFGAEWAGHQGAFATCELCTHVLFFADSKRVYRRRLDP